MTDSLGDSQACVKRWVRGTLNNRLGLPFLGGDKRVVLRHLRNHFTPGIHDYFTGGIGLFTPLLTRNLHFAEVMVTGVSYDSAMESRRAHQLMHVAGMIGAMEA